MDYHKKKRDEMVRVIRERYGLDTLEVLQVMEEIPRHKFLPRNLWGEAYEDKALPIGFGQTMSQPFTVAIMTDLVSSSLSTSLRKTTDYRLSSFAPITSELRMDKRTTAKFREKCGQKSNIEYPITNIAKVLEIGTGSGYQAAILSKLFDEVYSAEIVPQLAKKARFKIHDLGFKNIFVKNVSGEWGWKDRSPFDAIMVTADIKGRIPKKLLEQLKVGGVLVAPVRGEMRRYTKINYQLPISNYQSIKNNQMMNDKGGIKTTDHRLQTADKKKNEKLKNEKMERIGGIVYKIESFGQFNFVPFV